MRTPRPLGLTNKILTNKNKDRIKQEVVGLYIASNYYLNQKPMSTEQLAYYLDITPRDLINMMALETQKLSNLEITYPAKKQKEKNKIQQDPSKQSIELESDAQEANLASLSTQNISPNHLSAREVSKRIIFGVQEILHVASQQSQILIRAQGGKYKPFITAEVNRAISNQTAAIKPLMDFTRLLIDIEKHESFVPTQSINTNNLFISPAEALKMIENQGSKSMLTDESLKVNLIPQSSENWPNVDARSQDLSVIGIKQSSQS